MKRLFRNLILILFLFLIGATSYVAWANTLNPKEIYVFDMDGTLTPSRQPMQKEFAKWFKKFIARNDVYLVTGSDIGKIKSQIKFAKT
ncbi:MAG: hypothetical protein LBD98_04985 [Endomicrobium sp.]|jgi:hypothetical protein|nr:hypothetical protein [Endomicrobium sp.]